MDKHLVVVGARQVREGFTGATSSVEFFHATDEHVLLFFEKLHVFFAVRSVVWTSSLGIYANGVVEATSAALILAVALRSKLATFRRCSFLMLLTLILRILQRSHARGTLFDRERCEASVECVSALMAKGIVLRQQQLLLGNYSGTGLGSSSRNLRQLERRTAIVISKRPQAAWIVKPGSYVNSSYQRDPKFDYT